MNLDNKYFVTSVDSAYKIELSNFDRTLKISFGSKSVTLVELPKTFNFVVENVEEKIKISFQTILNVKKNFNRIFAIKLTWTYESLIKNAVKGLKTPYEKKVIVMWVWFKFYDELKSKNGISVSVGYCNNLFVDLKNYLNDVSVVMSKDSMSLSFTWADKFMVGQAASKFLHLKKFNRYNMTWIKYHDSVIIKKEVNKKN